MAERSFRQNASSMNQSTGVISSMEYHLPNGSGYKDELAPSVEDTGVISGTFYNASCVESIFNDYQPKFDFMEYVNYIPLPEIGLDKKDPSVKSYLNGNFGIEIPEDGSVGDFIRIVDVKDLPGFRSLANPSDSVDANQQGDVNLSSMVSSLWDSIYVNKIELDKIYSTFEQDLRKRINATPDWTDDQKKKAEVQLLDLMDLITGRIESECNKKEGESYNFLEIGSVEIFEPDPKIEVEEVVIKPISAAEPEPVPQMTWYSSDAMSRRRPPGSYFTVELVYPGQNGNFERMDVQTKNSNVTSLKLNTSPASLIVNGSKKINRTQTLTRWVEEHWGDELDQISFGGTTFSFLDYKVGMRGLDVESRELTEPFKELRHLVDIYKTNGCVYQGQRIERGMAPREFFNYLEPTLSRVVKRHPRSGMMKKRIYIKLSCDFAIMIGYFDSFDVVEQADKPHSLEYQVSFKSEHTIWL